MLKSFVAALLACSTPALADQAAPTPTPTHRPAGSFIGPAIYVADLEKSVTFYRDVIGMQVRLQFDEPTQKDAMIGFGSDPSQPSILLLSDKSGLPLRKVEHGHGYDRMVLFIADLPSLHDRLVKAGAKPTDIKEVHGMSMMMMVTDPDGYRLELIGAKPYTAR